MAKNDTFGDTLDRLPDDEFPPDLVSQHLDTNSYDGEVDWGKYPELGDDEDEYGQPDIPEHIGKWLSGDTSIMKAEPTQRLVTGWASVLTEPDGSPLFDREGDMVEEHDLVKAVHKYMDSPRHAGEVHYRTKDGKVKSVGTIVESLVVTKALKKALRLPKDFPTGWLITVKVSDDSVWDKVKNGTYKAFSVGGAGTREPVA